MSSADTPNWKAIGYVGISIAIGCIGGYIGQPLVHHNEGAVNVIVTLFSVLAGFLVAILTLVGDPTVFTGRAWRVQESARTKMRRRLIQQKYLFFVYLATLGTVFITTLIPKEYGSAIIWCERVYLAIAILGFLISFRLPGTLMQIQVERYDAMIETKRAKKE
jgi:hypothetical protein